MSIVEIILSSFYGLTGFGTFLRANFFRQLSHERANSDANNTQVAVNKALWEIRRIFETLFKDATARKNALNMFPTMRDLPEETSVATVVSVSYPRMVADSLFWPIMMPVNYSRKLAATLAANEAAAQAAQQDSYEILADHEEYEPLAEAFRSGDDERIQNAILAKADWQDKLDEAKRVSPQLSLDERQVNLTNKKGQSITFANR